MALNRGHSWLTYVSRDELTEPALALAASLRRVRTTAHICVITYGPVSTENKLSLRSSFDHVFWLESKSETDGALAKVFGFSCTLFEKCMFVDPHTIFLENIDNVFNRDVAGVVDLSGGKYDELFLLKPSIGICEYLEQQQEWKSIIQTSLFESLNDWAGNNGLTGNCQDGLYSDEQLEVFEFDIVEGRVMLNDEKASVQPQVVRFTGASGPAILDKLKTLQGDFQSSLGLIENAIINTMLELTTTKIPRLMNHRPYTSEPIAIIGMSCRFPNANNLSEFWDLLYSGSEGITTPPQFRWTRNHTIYGSTKERSTRAGFLKIPVDEFDSKYFGISPKDAVLLDPQARLLHELVVEGLENAGLDINELRGSHTGVFTGSWMNDYKDIIQGSTERDFFRTYMGNSIGATAARLSFLLGLTGPSVGTESGCSSAIAALDLAIKSLRSNETSVAITGGVNLLLHPFQSNIIDYVIAPDGRCKTFDEKADGFGRAEGCGVLVLKRLSDALRSSDNIWGIIRGSAISQEGISRSLGTPTVHCEALAMELALADANLNANDVSFVETHGTGTSVGDPMEVAAIAKAYGKRDVSNPLILGSVKTNVGHTESCSGITGIIKTVLAMVHECIPKHLNLESVNPNVKLEAVPAVLPLTNMEWRATDVPRYAGVSSFGITGTDGHVVLEEAPKWTYPRVVFDLERPTHLIKFSCKSAHALDELLGKFADYFATSTDKIQDLAYTCNVGRASWKHRAAIVVQDNQDAFTALQTAEKVIRGAVEDVGVQAPICFVFTGQGSQYAKMGAGLYESNGLFRSYFDYADWILNKKYGLDIRHVVFGTSDELISQTIYSQTSVFVIEYCLLQLWKSWGVTPGIVVGHSLGEYCAAVAAGMLKFEDALRLVVTRAKLIDKLHRGSMGVINAGLDDTNRMIKDNGVQLDIAAINTNSQTVVAGHSDQVDILLKACKASGIKCTTLASSHAFHSKHMEAILEEYDSVCKDTVYSKASCIFVSGCYGTEYSNLTPNYWTSATREPVRFLDACNTLKTLDCKYFIEIGPQPVLSTFIQLNMDEFQVTTLPSLRKNTNDWDVILKSLSNLYVNGYDIDWKSYDKPYHRKKLPLEIAYPFTRKSYWVDCERSNKDIAHPLVGYKIQNASNTSIFANTINAKSVGYLQDHCIGDMTVFPGACFTEMCIAAGYFVATSNPELEKLRTPISIENVTIHAPLQLQENKSTRFQVTVVLNDQSNALQCTVHTKNKDETSWVTHATGDFHAYVHVRTSVDKARIMEIIETKSNSTDKFYKSIDNAGLRFGESFRTLQKYWSIHTDGSQFDEIVAELLAPEDSHKYVIHPTTLDAMIQTALLCGWSANSSNEHVNLRVPVRIGKLVLVTNEFKGKIILHGVWESDKAIITALDEDFNVIAVLEDIVVLETNVKTIGSVLAQQVTEVPDSWEEIWKPIKGPNTNCIQLSDISTVVEEWLETEIAAGKNQSCPTAELELSRMNRLTYLYMLQALQNCGWKPEKDEILDQAEFCKRYNILPSYEQLLRFYFTSFSQELGLVEVIQEEDRFKVARVISDLSSHVETEISQLLEWLKGQDNVRSITLIYERIGSMLHDILTGEKSVLPVLYPLDSQSHTTDTDQISAEAYYQCYPGRVLIKEKISDIIQRIWQSWATQNEDKVIRVLEVGAGTGSMSKNTVQMLASIWGDRFEYYFTDISAVFFPKAEKLLSQHLANIKFLPFNIEEPAIEQGIPLNYFDTVLASDVLHATKNLSECLTNLRSTLRNSGNICFTDTMTQDRGITFVFGLLDGYWRFQDKHVRAHHTCVDGPTWELLLRENGFEYTRFRDTYFGIMGYVTGVAGNSSVHSLPCSKRVVLYAHNDIMCAEISRVTGCEVEFVRLPEPCTEEVVKQVVEKSLINPEMITSIIYAYGLSDTKDQREIALPFLYIAKNVLNLKKPPKIYALTRGIHPIQELYDTNPSGATLFGLTKSLKNEHAELFVRYVDVSCDESELTDILAFELASFKESREKERVQIGYRDGTRYEPKFNKSNVPKRRGELDLQLPGFSHRYQLKLPDSRVFNDLSYEVLEPFDIGENQVEIRTTAFALNFRDIFAILKPTEECEKFNSVGLDFSGEVIRVGEKVETLSVGDRVVGINLNDTRLPSHILVDPSYCMRIPDQMTYEEACTLPAVFSTAYHCLVSIAEIKRTDTVLIHTGSGGVGLAAIQLASHVGANIICTAGSKRKRAYLRGLGIKHVFHSRNTSYADEILKVTNNRGVDLVLNSLTGPGFKEATLRACAEGARFIEMSKMSVWTPDEVKALRPDIEYWVVDLTTVDRSVMTNLVSVCSRYMNTKMFNPIPYVRFDALRIRQAFSYFQKAKHIGKIVVSMPEVSVKKGQWTVNTRLFNNYSTYLITGGMGGIGFEVCKWMVNHGATDIVLMGRTNPSEIVQNHIDDLNTKGCNITVMLCDVGVVEDLKGVINKINDTMKPLRGIHHCAGNLRDNVYGNQTWELFEAAYTPKITGTWNLHECTKSLLLEHFVLYSSMTALAGTPAQSNHSSANCFEDAFAHFRNSLGLPGCAINWGQWSQVGCAKEVNVTGVLPVSVNRMLNGLEEVLRSQRLQVAFGEFENLNAWGIVCPNFKYYLDERLAKNLASAVTTLALKSDQFWSDLDSEPNKEEKLKIVASYMKAIVRSALRMDADEPINDHANMKDLGVDSLMLIELKNSIQSLLGSRLIVSANMLKDCNTIADLATCIIDKLYGGAEELMELDTAELEELIKADCVLPEDIQITSNPCAINEMSRVLVTGATGNLGPYILQALQPLNLTEIVCLIRNGNSSLSEEKLKQASGRLDLNFSSIKYVTGDITEPNFGLESEEYDELCNYIDAVIHLAAKSNHAEPYVPTCESRKNVVGTLNVLRFAARLKTKHVFHASSLLSVIGKGSDETALSDNWPEDSEISTLAEHHALGYPVSKFVCEMLMKQAVARGVPCKVFRFPWILGDSITGELNYASNHYVLRFMSYLKIKSMPHAPVPAIVLPVDVCADWSVRLFLIEDTGSEVFNIAHPVQQLEVEFAQVSPELFGVTLELVDWECPEFTKRLYNNGMPLESLQELYKNVDVFVNVAKNEAFAAIHGYLSYPVGFFRNEKLERFIPGFANNLNKPVDYVVQALKYVKSAGLFEKFGVETSI